MKMVVTNSLFISGRVRHAIEVVLDIAWYTGGQSVQSTDIAKRQHIPRRYLEKTLQQLVRQGILQGVRGPKGGYRLSRERRRISVGEIVTAMHAAQTVAKSSLPKKNATFGAVPMPSELGEKVIAPLLLQLDEVALQYLNGISIDDLCLQASRAGIRGGGAERFDFSI